MHERIRIADRAREPGVSLRVIAAELGCPVSTISRELDRNQQSEGTCQPYAAHEGVAGRRGPAQGRQAGRGSGVAGHRPGWAGCAVEPAADRLPAAPRPWSNAPPGQNPGIGRPATNLSTSRPACGQVSADGPAPRAAPPGHQG
ncbi:helix-turn-helix domain-containing protein [Amycolatopsis iheyensis]|uniref:helix-turn-helix domain-containing protein n=1 Tax=Amycolatopsis iheyensis TaxID=2945988 RepID=UPI003557869D